MSTLMLRDRAVAAARQLVAMANPMTLPIDLLAYARVQGVTQVMPKSMRESGRLLTAGRVRIEFNREHSTARQRFTICHELAHTFFIRDSQKRRIGIHVDRPLDPSLEEQLCDVIAGELLMPESMFRSQSERLQPGMLSVDELSDLFSVSRMAVLIRVMGLRPSPWNCALAKWQVSTCSGPFPQFRLVTLQSAGEVDVEPLRKGLVTCWDGLCKTLKQRRLGVDETGRIRLESRVVTASQNIKDVWSLVLSKDSHVRE